MQKIIILISFIMIVNVSIGQTVTEFSTGYTTLEGVAINANNEVFVSEHDSGKIFRLDANGTPTQIAIAGGYANDMVFDDNGILYVAEPFTNKISIVDLSTGNLSLYISTFNSGYSPYGLVFYNGLMYYSSETSQKVVQINTDLSTVDYASGFVSPEGIAFDANGNLYVADRNVGKLYRITPSGVQTVVVDNVSGIRGVAVSAAGDVYFTKDNSYPAENKILKYDPATGIVTDFVTTMLDQPRSIEIDHLGNMYVANAGNGKLIKISDASLSTDILSKNEFKIYPNPASKYLTVNLPVKKLCVYDTNGRELLSATHQKINIEGLSAGVYLLQIQDINNHQITGKFIKK